MPVKLPLIGKENDTSSLDADKFHQYCERVALPDRMFISFGDIHIYLPFKSYACFALIYLVWSVCVTTSASVHISTSHSFVTLACAKCFLLAPPATSYIRSISVAPIVLVFSVEPLISTVGVTAVGLPAPSKPIT